MTTTSSVQTKEWEPFYQNLYSSKVAADNQDGAFLFPQQEDRTFLNRDEDTHSQLNTDSKNYLHPLSVAHAIIFRHAM